MHRVISILFLLLPALLLFAGYFHPISALNQDLGRHLLTGTLILTSHTVPKTNLLSYTYPDFPFINHHWFSEVIFAALHDHAGFLGLFILSLILIFLACALIVIRGTKESSIPIVTGIALFYLPILFERTDLRPELFSFLYLSAIITLLFSYRERYTKLIFLIIPIELLWVNSHIYFPIGILLLVLFSLDSLWTHRTKLFTTQPLSLYITTALSGLVTLFNPNGITGALYPLRVFSNYGYTIEENQTPFFLQSIGYAKPAFPYLVIAIILLFLFLLLTYKKARLIDWLLALVFSIVALQAVRNFPLFVFATFIPMARAAHLTLVPRLKRLTEPQRRLGIMFVFLIFTLFSIWQISNITSHKSFGYGVIEDGEKALTFVKEQKLKGPIFNNFDIGSYIAYRLYPQQKVFIDGRPEAYPASFIQQSYIPLQEKPEIFDQLSNKYHFKTIIFSHTDQSPWAETFMQSIVKNPIWKTVYLDDTMIILSKDLPENQMLIKKFARPYDQFDLVSLQDPSDSLRQAAHFYAITKQWEKVQTIFQELYKRNPEDCQVFATLLSVMSTNNDPAASILLSRYRQNCQ